MLKKSLFAIALVMLLVSSTAAREGARTIFGVVTCAGQPVAGARVTVTGGATYTTRTAVSNAQGVYVVNKLPVDEYIIRVQGPKPGMFKPGHGNVVLAQQQRQVNFSLRLP